MKFNTTIAKNGVAENLMILEALYAVLHEKTWSQDNTYHRIPILKICMQVFKILLKVKNIPSVNSQLSQNVGDKYIVFIFIFLCDLYFYNKYPLILRGKA